MIYNADCYDILEGLDSKSVDAIITDPPYATTSIKWDTQIDLDRFWYQVKRVLRTPSSPAIIFADQPFTSALVMSNVPWFRHDYIWKKPQHSGAHNVRKRPLKYTEDILVFSAERANYYYEQVCVPLDKPKVVKYNLDGVRTLGKHKEDVADHTTFLTGYPKEVLEFKAVRGGKHPTEKPVDLMEHLIHIYTHEGDVVLDPFMGSGSTGVACKNLGRDFIGVEKSEEFYKIAGERLAS